MLLMGEKLDIAKISVKYEDVFSLKELYKFIREKLREYQWIDDESEKWMERFYLEKNVAGAKEIWIYWRSSKEPDKHPFIRYHLNVDYHVLNMKDVEIVHEGKKIKTTKGEVEVILTTAMELDYKNEWGKPPLKTIYSWFKKRFYRDIIDFRKKELYNETYALQGSIKQFLDLKVITPQEMFHPVKGLA